VTLGIACGVGMILAEVVLVQSAQDLGKMRAKLMDPSERKLTIEARKLAKMTRFMTAVAVPCGCVLLLLFRAWGWGGL
jgi:hypothetical protein